MIRTIRNGLRGSLLVDLQGGGLERLLNLCAAGGVAFWDVRPLDPGHFTAWISVRSYAALRAYGKKTGCQIRVRKKRGFPFGARKLSRRWALWGGLLLSAALVAYLSGFVWTIQVQGCRQTTPEEVVQLLKRAGLTTGSRRSDCDPRALRNQVMLITDKLSYLTVNFRGTQAVVEVWERENTGKQVPADQPCDVVSDLTGIVLDLRVRTGQAQVKVGDTLQPGDRIASGRWASPQGEDTLVHAQAEADLRTWYTRKAVVPAELQLLVREGPAAAQKTLLLGARRFPVGRIEKNSFPWYDKQIETRDLSPQEDIRWPAAFSRETAYLCRTEPADIDEARLKTQLERRMTARLLAERPGARLAQASLTLEKTDQGAWMAVLTAELVETTGREVPMEQEESE